MTPENVYNMDETSFVLLCSTNQKTKSKEKSAATKIQKDRLTLALVINTIGSDKLKLVIIYKSLCPRCFGRWLPRDYVWWFAN